MINLISMWMNAKQFDYPILPSQFFPLYKNSLWNVWIWLTSSGFPFPWLQLQATKHILFKVIMA